MPDQSSAATEHAILQEITRPLESLPDDPLSVVNAEFPTALRGYDRIAVDEYVQRTRQLVAELQATRSPEAAVRRALERVGEEITGILQRAHETAEQITAQSRREAEDRLEQVRVEARQITDVAEARVRDLDTDTDRIWLERQRIVADAEDLAAQLHGLARTAAERFPADVEAEAAGPVPEAAEAIAESEDAGEVTAETAEHESPGEITADQDYLDDSEGEFFESAQPRPQSEIERTMAFEPLHPPEAEAEPEAEATPSGGPTDPPAAPQPPSYADPSGQLPPAPAPPEPELDPDATTIIPPSSPAASRRFGE